MRVARFQWPDDMTPEELALAPQIEAHARFVLRDASRTPNAAVAFEALTSRLFSGYAAVDFARLSGYLAIVTEEESYEDGGIRRMGIRVRFRWTRNERERREARRRVMRPTPAERDHARARMTVDQWGTARDGNGVCMTCSADISMWCDLVAHRQQSRDRQERRDRDQRVIGRAVGWNWEYGADYAGPRCEIDLIMEDGQTRTFELDRGEETPEAGAVYFVAAGGFARRAPTQTHRVVTASYHAHVEIPRSEIERARASSDLNRMTDQIAAVESLARMGLAMDGDAARQMLGLAPPEVRVGNVTATGSSYGLASGQAMGHDPAFDRSPETSIARVVERIDEITHPVAVMFVGFLRDVTLKDFLRGHVARRRTASKMGLALDPPVRGNDEDGLRDLLMTREPGDAFYYIAPAQFPTPQFLPHLRFEPAPGSLEERIQEAANARRRAAVDLLVQIVNVALRARERACWAAAAFHVFARAALAPWAAAPSPIEIDVHYKPFGVDLAPAEDATAARFALLEIGDSIKP